MRRTAPLLLAWVAASTGLAAESSTPIGYRLYPGDLLSISVFDHEDLAVDIRVPVEGPISFPLLGAVDGIVGITDADFARKLQIGLEDNYLKQAIVTVTVTEFGPRLAYVMGSVERADGVELSPFAPTTALQAVSKAGGFTEDANRSQVKVIRDLPDGTKTAIPVPSSGDGVSNDIALQPLDIVVVPQLDKVFVLGRVGNPSSVNIPSEGRLTVSKAISLAGGFEKFSRRDAVQLLRSNRPNLTVKVSDILSGTPGTVDPVLEPGDTIFVPESRF